MLALCRPRRRSPLLGWPIEAAVAPPPPPPPAVSSFKPALVAFLQSTPAVASLIRQLEPVHPSEVGTYPGLTWRVSERAPGVHLDGDAGFADATVDFTARSELPADVDALVLALSALFHGKGNYLMSGVPVMRSLADSDSDDYEDAGDDEDDGTFSDSITIRFRYRTR